MTTTRLTTKGARTRARIVDAAAALMARRGVADTTVGDVLASAEVSSSQLYHYFNDKDALVRAVIERQTELVVGTQERTDLGTPEGLRAWRDAAVDHSRRVSGVGGCPMGHLVGQLAESDEEVRTRLAAGFDRWADALRTGMRDLDAAGGLRAGTDPDELAATLLATLQGGLLLAQVQRDATLLATALDTLLAMALTDGWFRASEVR